MKHTLIALALTASTLGVAGTAMSQNTQPAQRTTQHPGLKVDMPANLRARAKISETAARATAAARVPRGTIQAGELEEENGKLQYSYDIKVPGQTGIEEVNVNAIDGSIIAVQHESPASLRKETEEDRKDSAKPHHSHRSDSARVRKSADRPVK
jgi:uncharacterized membrane protein YkoI